MCDSDNHQGFIVDTSVTRRSAVLGISSIAAAAALPRDALAATKVIESEVSIATGDGNADAVLFHPAGKSSWPAVLLWPDILGLRPVFREMGRRLAGEGYTVLVPNPFYRSQKAPVVTGAFDFNKPDDRAKFHRIGSLPLMGYSKPSEFLAGGVAVVLLVRV